MEVGGFDALEATEAGLREGVFFDDAARRAATRRCSTTSARASVLNLAAQYHADVAHTEHVARLALEIWDALAAAGVHGGDPAERELLWAAAMLHDIGTAVDYDDHHKHSRYLILNAGLPGFSPRETALIGQMARYHRKGTPGARRVRPARRATGDDELLDALRRRAAGRRAARALARPGGRAARTSTSTTARVELELRAARGRHGRAAGRPSARRDLFERAFGRELEVSESPAASARRASARRPDGDELALGRRPRRPPPPPPRAPPSGSASQVTRIIPVATFSSPTTTRPQMTSPSSQPMRSMSNHDEVHRGWPCRPRGSCLSWASLALQTACMFLAEASTCSRLQEYPGIEDAVRVERRLAPRAARRRTAPGAGAS